MADDNGKKDTNDVKEPTGFTKRERQMIKERFGIVLGSDAPLSEFFDLFDITEEKIAAIEAGALRKLRERAPHCSICGKFQSQVSQLFGSQDNLICDKCIEARI